MPAPPAPSRRRILRDMLDAGSAYSYGRSRHQVAELRMPEGDEPHPVAVVLHGGYWRARYSRRTTRPLAADLARRGWASWNLEYRRIGRGQGGGWPATFQDVAAGIDLLAETEPGRLDLERVVAIGHSAGGHLALWAAGRPSLPDGVPGASPRVHLGATVALAAVSDLEAAPTLLEPGEPVHDLVGGPPATVPDRYRVANPRRLLPLGVPILLVHWDEDETVPPKRSRQFEVAAREAGDRVDLIEPPGADHRRMIDPRSAAWESTTRWLDGLGWLAAAGAPALRA